jgi:hypothetical protein
MNEPIIIIGIGQLASVFAQGFLRCGYPVYPITRKMNLAVECLSTPSPQLVLVAVQENELHSVLGKLPKQWLHKVALIQNELLPRDWHCHAVKNPTVTVVWFEKKKGSQLTNILYSPSFGPNSGIISAALQAVEIASPVLKNEDELLYELVRKAVYILTINISGLLGNCTVGELWEHHQILAREVAEDVICIQESRLGKKLSHEKLISGMVEGIQDYPQKHCLGRHALSRLEHAIEYAQKSGIKAAKLLEIYNIVKQS